MEFEKCAIQFITCGALADLVTIRSATGVARGATTPGEKNKLVREIRVAVKNTCGCW